MLRQGLNGTDSSSFKNIIKISDMKSVSVTTISKNIGKLDNQNHPQGKARVQSAPATLAVNAYGLF
jgi:hypothetical protein